MTDEQKFKCKQILEHCGADNQLKKLCEECAELVQAAIKHDVDRFINEKNRTENIIELDDDDE